MNKGYAPVDKGHIYYEEAGSGKPVVLIHAGYLDLRMWDREFIELSAEYRVVRYDVRGYGKSSLASARFSDYLDLRGLLERLEIEHAILVGVSNGGRIALDFAVEYPGMVDALVLVNFGIRGYDSDEDIRDLWGDLPDLEEEYLRLRSSGEIRKAAAIDVDYWTHSLPPDLRERILDIAEENVRTDDTDPERFQVSPEPPAFVRLTTLRMPVCIIIGDNDRRGIKIMDRKVHENLPDSRIFLIPGADHIPGLSMHEDFMNILRNFLKTIQ